MRQHLVIVRAGDTSLHPQWLGNDSRKWDLALSYQGDFPDRYKGQYDFLHQCRGSKWEGITQFLTAHSTLVRQYQYVWFPDDSLLTCSDTIDAFFAICTDLDLTIAQPALTDYSHYNWQITLQQSRWLARLTNFVEVMAPCFKVQHLHLFSPYFAENTSGWGYEWLWAHIAEANFVHRLGIVDQTPVFLTRAAWLDEGINEQHLPTLEWRQLLQKFGLRLRRPEVLSALTLPQNSPTAPNQAPFSVLVDVLEDEIRSLQDVFARRLFG
ncbi:MAG: hypothetical protein EBZ60_03560 [Betaproteobacteria bacterium]|nr:hypothetical protein [Betaproteobacteria bacterium]